METSENIENCEKSSNESLQETEESLTAEEAIPQVIGDDDIKKKLQEAEEKIAKLEENISSKTDLVKFLEQQKIEQTKEVNQVLHT